MKKLYATFFVVNEKCPNFMLEPELTPGKDTPIINAIIEFDENLHIDEAMKNISETLNKAVAECISSVNKPMIDFLNEQKNIRGLKK